MFRHDASHEDPARHSNERGREMHPRDATRYRVAVIIPMQGPGGIFGPSCIAVSELAARELNRSDGIGGREVELVYLDGGRHPRVVAAELGRLIDTGAVDAVTGWHISSIRQHLTPVVRGRIPYVYTSLYEGGEGNANVYCSGETPEQQVFPAMRWLRDHRGIRSWYVLGASYVWPRRSYLMVERFASALNVDIVGSSFVEMGSADDPSLPRAVAASGCAGVLILLVGQDAVYFHRHFAEQGWDRSILRFSPLMEENMLLASGEGATENLYSSAAYFRSLVTGSALDLIGNYVHAEGAAAPVLNNMAESCYQGIYTLANLARQAGTTDVERYDDVVDGLTFDSPRGLVRFEGNQARQCIYLARADGFDFDVLESL